MTSYKDIWKDSNFYNDVKNNKKIIIDINYLNNKIIYSLDRYSTFPDSIKYVKYIDKDKKIRIDKKIYNRRKENRKIIENQKKRNLTLISLIAMRHKEKFF